MDSMWDLVGSVFTVLWPVERNIVLLHEAGTVLCWGDEECGSTSAFSPYDWIQFHRKYPLSLLTGGCCNTTFCAFSLPPLISTSQTCFKALNPGLEWPDGLAYPCPTLSCCPSLCSLSASATALCLAASTWRKETSTGSSSLSASASTCWKRG